MKQFVFVIKYLRYWFSAKTAHGTHSPFVFNLYNEVINKQNNYYSFDRIEQLRKRLLQSEKEIDVKDLGAGRSGKRAIREITSRSAKSPKYGRLLFRLAHHFKPEIILELGTSLGLSTAYLASAGSKAKIITIEGCPNTSEEAKKNFELLGLKNIESVVGNFNTALPDILRQRPACCTFVFIDGNHRREPVLNYFSQCLEHAGNNSVFVIDDIHWSGEMEEAWEEIKRHPKVTVTIDLHFLGLVFFRAEQAKENFRLRF